jgi:hypothetical protein
VEFSRRSYYAYPIIADFNDAGLFASVIAELELFAKPAVTPEEKTKTAAFFRDNVTIIEIDDPLKKKPLP